MCAYCKAKVEARTTCCDRVFRGASSRLGLNLVAPTTIHFSSSRRTYTNEDVREREWREIERVRESSQWDEFCHLISFLVMFVECRWFVAVTVIVVVVVLPMPPHECVDFGATRTNRENYRIHSPALSNRTASQSNPNHTKPWVPYLLSTTKKRNRCSSRWDRAFPLPTDARMWIMWGQRSLRGRVPWTWN